MVPGDIAHSLFEVTSLMAETPPGTRRLRRSADRAGEGWGLRVTFTLPVAEEPAPVTFSDGPPPQAGKKISVLAVDDDPNALRLLRDTLVTGYAPAVTGDPEEIPGLVEAKRPRLALLDLALAGADGIELMQTLPALAGLPVIFVSAYGREPAPFRLGDLVIDYALRRITVAGCRRGRGLRLMTADRAGAAEKAAAPLRSRTDRRARFPRLAMPGFKTRREGHGDDGRLAEGPASLGRRCREGTRRLPACRATAVQSVEDSFGKARAAQRSRNLVTRRKIDGTSGGQEPLHANPVCLAIINRERCTVLQHPRDRRRFPAVEPIFPPTPSQRNSNSSV